MVQGRKVATFRLPRVVAFSEMVNVRRKRKRSRSRLTFHGLGRLRSTNVCVWNNFEFDVS